jgi:hypothetical protein
LHPQRPHRVAFAFERDPVIGLRGEDLLVVHQIAQDVDEHAGVSVPLGVGVPERIRVDAAPVERFAAPAGVDSVAHQLRDRVDPPAQ